MQKAKKVCSISPFLLILYHISRVLTTVGPYHSFFMSKHSLFASFSAVTVAISSSAAKPSPSPAPTLEEQMLSHVEKVFVIDSINVDRADFFKNYRLFPSAGRILTGQEVARTLRGVEVPDDFDGAPFPGFTNEFNDFLIWAQQDTTGMVNIAESSRLIDGSWSTPEFTLEFPDVAFPFMSDDGQTLYFASDNEASLGGYDIFVATKDPSDGEYLIPGNMGMPFNSPFDDYMMAIDRQAGIGWWATDRNQLEDQITIYVYALSDERVNVDPDDENIMSYATLSGWESLLDEDQLTARDRLLSIIKTIKPKKKRSPELYLPVPSGKIYLFYSDFKNPKAASKMQLYMARKASFEEKQHSLSKLRARFAKGDTGISSNILELEESLREEEASLSSLLSEIYQLEL